MQGLRRACGCIYRYLKYGITFIATCISWYQRGMYRPTRESKSRPDHEQRTPLHSPSSATSNRQGVKAPGTNERDKRHDYTHPTVKLSVPVSAQRKPGSSPAALKAPGRLPAQPQRPQPVRTPEGQATPNSVVSAYWRTRFGFTLFQPRRIVRAIAVQDPALRAKTQRQVLVVLRMYVVLVAAGVAWLEFDTTYGTQLLARLVDSLGASAAIFAGVLAPTFCLLLCAVFAARWLHSFVHLCVMPWACHGCYSAARRARLVSRIVPRRSSLCCWHRDRCAHVDPTRPHRE